MISFADFFVTNAWSAGCRLRLWSVCCLFLVLLTGPEAWAQLSGPVNMAVGAADWYLYEVPSPNGKIATWSGSTVSIEQGQNTAASGVGAHGYLRFNEIGNINVSCCLYPSGECGYLNVMVHPLPPSISSVTPSSVCGSASVSMSVNYPGVISGSYDFRWYTSATGGSSIATGATLIRGVSATTTYYVSTYSAIGGESLTRTAVTIPVVTQPQSAPGVTPVAAIGEGNNVTLAATGATSGISYKWFSADGILFATTEYTQPSATRISPASSTDHFVYVKLSSGTQCDGPLAWIPITLYPQPAIAGTGIALGEPATLTCNTGYDTFEWYIAGNPNPIKVSSGPGDNTYITAQQGTYTVKVTKSGSSGESDPFTLSGQFDNQNQNYIITNTIQRKGVAPSDNIENLTKESNTQAAHYFDGLGRPMQTVATQGSPEGRDIVQPVVYDEFGREVRIYLPVVPQSSDGWFKPDLINSSGNYTGVAADFYTTGGAIATDSKPYAETIFEASPLNRVLRQGAPGEAWQPGQAGTYAEPSPADHSVKKAYEFNRADEVMLLNYNVETHQIGLGATSYYAINQLQANKTKDEHNREVIEYVDKEGQTILKKVEIEEANGVKNYAETYYIYDDFGTLVMVLPPEATLRIKALLIP